MLQVLVVVFVVLISCPYNADCKLIIEHSNVKNGMVEFLVDNIIPIPLEVNQSTEGMSSSHLTGTYFNDGLNKVSFTRAKSNSNSSTSLTTSRVSLECRFPDIYNNDYENVSSESYKHYTDNILRKMNAAFETRLLNLIKINFQSLRRGSVITTMSIDMYSNVTMNSSQIQTSVVNATKAAFNGSVNVTMVNVTETSKIISSQTSPMTSTNTTTTSTKTPVFVTNGPPKMGEYQIQIDIVCKYNDTFIVTYADPGSQDYQNYINNIKNKYLASSSFRALLRLIDITVNSLRQGSVIADMQMNVATNSSSASAIETAVNAATNEMFPSSSIIALKANFIALIGTYPPPLSTQAPKFEEWKIDLIAIAVLFPFFSIIVIIVLVTIRIRGRDVEVLKYVDEHPEHPTTQEANINDGIMLRTWSNTSKTTKFKTIDRL